MKRILVATDGSEDAQRAVHFAAALAQQNAADLIVANVMGGNEFSGSLMQQLSTSQSAWIKETLTADSAKILQTARASLQDLGLPRIKLESRLGDPAETIIEIAEKMNADAIVVGKRGQGRVQGLLLGSVSQKLVSLAKTVVIVVP